MIFVGFSPWPEYFTKREKLAFFVLANDSVYFLNIKPWICGPSKSSSDDLPSRLYGIPRICFATTLKDSGRLKKSGDVLHRDAEGGRDVAH
jgi:hypothetical protein